MAIQGYNKNGIHGRISELKIKTRLHDWYSTSLTPGDNVFTVSFKTSESKLCCNYCIAFCVALSCLVLCCVVLYCIQRNMNGAEMHTTNQNNFWD